MSHIGWGGEQQGGRGGNSGEGLQQGVVTMSLRGRRILSLPAIISSGLAAEAVGVGPQAATLLLLLLRCAACPAVPSPPPR